MECEVKFVECLEVFGYSVFTMTKKKMPFWKLRKENWENRYSREWSSVDFLLNCFLS